MPVIFELSVRLLNSGMTRNIQFSDHNVHCFLHSSILSFPFRGGMTDPCQRTSESPIRPITSAQGARDAVTERLRDAEVWGVGRAGAVGGVGGVLKAYHGSGGPKHAALDCHTLGEGTCGREVA